MRKELSWQDYWQRLLSAAVWSHQTERRASFWTSVRVRVKPLSVETVMVSSSQIKSRSCWNRCSAPTSGRGWTGALLLHLGEGEQVLCSYIWERVNRCSAPTSWRGWTGALLLHLGEGEQVLCSYIWERVNRCSAPTSGRGWTGALLLHLGEGEQVLCSYIWERVNRCSAPTSGRGWTGALLLHLGEGEQVLCSYIWERVNRCSAPTSWRGWTGALLLHLGEGEQVLCSYIWERVNRCSAPTSGRGWTGALLLHLGEGEHHWDAFLLCAWSRYHWRHLHCSPADKLLYFAFVDLEKAFDCVPRKVLSWAIKEPQCQRVGCVHHPGHVLQCLESWAGQWSVQWGV